MTTQQLPEMGDSPRRRRSPHMVPWIVVGLVVVVALVVSTVVLKVVRGGDADETSGPSSSAGQTSSPTPPSKSEDQDPDEKDDGGVPDVEVGPTSTMPIDPWSATSEISQKFGSNVSYRIEGDNLVLSSPLIESLPDSCADMRGQWGATRSGDKYEVLKPAEKCDAAPEIYDELWGLTAAFVETIAPV